MSCISCNMCNLSGQIKNCLNNYGRRVNHFGWIVKLNIPLKIYEFEGGDELM